MGLLDCLAESENVSVCIHIHLENTKDQEIFLLTLIFAKIQSVCTMYISYKRSIYLTAKRRNIEASLIISLLLSMNISFILSTHHYEEIKLRC